MSMSASATSGINVTPLIDILLVLLIIFMVLVPVPPKGLGAMIPQPNNSRSASDPPATIVVEVRGNGTDEPIYKLNQTEYAKHDLEAKLAAIFAVREEKVMFVQADAALDFSKVAEVVDMGHQASEQSIGLLTQRDSVGR